MSLVIADRPFVEGSKNMGGLADQVYAIPASDIKTFVVDEDDETGLTVTTITCNTGKKFAKLYFTRGTGSIEATEQGPRDAGSFVNTLMFKSPKLDYSLLRLKAQLNNGGFVFIVVDAQGTVFIIGTPQLPAYREAAKLGSGTEAKDGAFGEFKLVADSPIPMQIFTGSIPLTPGA